MHVSEYNLYYRTTAERKVCVVNTLQGSVTLLPDDLALALMRATAVGVCSALPISRTERDSLMQLGILAVDRETEQAKLRYRRRSVRFTPEFVPLTIFATTRCNFRCSYCYEDVPASSSDMDREDWGILYRYIRESMGITSSSHLEVRLYGGEPLLNPELILRVAADLKSWQAAGPQIRISLITNGSLITKRLVGAFSGLVDHVQITVDGPRARHDRLRPYADGGASYDDVLRGLRLCTESGIPQIVVRVNYNVNEVSEVRSFIVALRDEVSSVERILPVFSRISPSLSVLRSGCCAPDPGEVPEALRLQSESARLGYRAVDFRLPQWGCEAHLAQGTVVGPDLGLYRCSMQFPGQPLARLVRGGEVEVVDPSWYDLSIREPGCLETCAYAPVCSEGCPVLPQSIGASTGAEDCAHKSYAKAAVEGWVQMRLGNAANVTGLIEH